MSPAAQAGDPSADVDTDSPVVRIGRDPSQCDVVVDDPSVSALHCQIRKGAGVTYFLVEDLGSAHGTWARRKRVEDGAPAAVRIGDWMSLGPKLQFVLRPEHVAKLAPGGAWVDPKRLTDPAGAALQIPANAAPVDATAPLGDTGLVAGTAVTIGRDPSNTIVRDEPGVARFHCSLTKLPNGRFRVHDEGSISGTFVEGAPHRIDTSEVGLDAALQIGGWRFKLSHMTLELQAQEQRRRGRALGDADEVILGRGESEAELRATTAGMRLDVDDPLVSRRHAILRKTNDGAWMLFDLGSSAGAYVNGQRVTRPARVGPDDQITLGGNRFRVSDAGRLKPDDDHDCPLTVDRISRELGGGLASAGRRTLIKDVSFAVRPGELLAVLGPSGCGKTTLLRCLAGEERPDLGAVRIGERDLHDHWSELAPRICYVPQDDIVHPLLTARECLHYAARLRLPADTTPTELDSLVDRVLSDLDLRDAAHTLIGDAARKGISGGQRRRVNLALELLTSPRLLFLDEPTSGLSSEDALHVIRLLRSIADTGCTVLVTIHQPSLEVYTLFDVALYMVSGEVAYFGPAWPGASLWFHPHARAGAEQDKLLADPGAALRALSSPEAARGWVEEWKAPDNSTRRQFTEDRMSRAADIAEVEFADGDKAVAPGRPSVLGQTVVLIDRGLRMRVRDRGGLVLALAQAPILAALIVIALSQKLTGQTEDWFHRLTSGPAALFLLVLAGLWLGCQAGAREIVSERTILRRERRVGLRTSAYTLSKLGLLAAVGVVQCAILTVLVHQGLSLSATIGRLVAVVLLAQLTGAALGLLISAISRSGVQAASLVPLCLLPQIVLGGVIVPLPELPAPAAIVAQAMPARWALEAAMHLEHGTDTEIRIQRECGIDACVLASAALPNDSRESGRVLCATFCRSRANGKALSPMDRMIGHRGTSLCGASGSLLGLFLLFAGLVPVALGRRRIR